MISTFFPFGFNQLIILFLSDHPHNAKDKGSPTAKLNNTRKIVRKQNQYKEPCANQNDV